MDALKARYARYKQYLSRDAATGPGAMLHTVIGYLAYALGLDDTPPDEVAQRGLVAAHRGDPLAPQVGTEQRGLLAELAYALTQAQVITETSFGVLTSLPDDFPYRSYLVDGGVETVEALRGLAFTPERLGEVNGIGEERTDDIMLALKKLDAPPEAPPGANEPPGTPEIELLVDVVDEPALLEPETPTEPELPETALGEAEPETLAEVLGQPVTPSEPELPVEPEPEPVLPEAEGPTERVPLNRTIVSEETVTLLDETSGIPHYELLLKGGFATVEAVKAATDFKILDAPGIGPAKLLEIRAALDAM